MLPTKISLIYASDYALSLGSDALDYRSDVNYNTLLTGWIFITNNDTDTDELRGGSEWTMSRSGSYSGYYVAWLVTSVGTVNYNLVYSRAAVRPVFYLESDVEISGGTGTSSDPFLLKVN